MVRASVGVVTVLVLYPKYKACRIWLGAGEKREISDEIVPDIEKWARERGCARMEVMGRKGWTRVLRSYEQTHTVLERAL